MAKWEYAAIPIITDLKRIGKSDQKDMLDQLGSEGWELVSTVVLKVEKSLDVIAYFKREKK
ncbi:MAG: DUF4177 domain-containing protein [Candidatus Bathyarchaeia archaeon]